MSKPLSFNQAHRAVVKARQDVAAIDRVLKNVSISEPTRFGLKCARQRSVQIWEERRVEFQAASARYDAENNERVRLVLEERARNAAQ